MNGPTEHSPPVEPDKLDDEATIETHLKILRTVHLVLAAGSLLFGVVAFFLAPNISGGGGAFSGWVGVFFLVPAVAFSFFIGRSGRKHVQESAGPPEKDAEAYTHWKLISWAPLEGVAFLSLILYVITYNSIFVGLAALLLVGLFFLRASREEFEAFRAKRPRE